jgi:hypothetical protein
MIYLIGGAPRVGKTTLSRMIMERKGIPFLSTDVIRDAVDKAYPQLGLMDAEWEKRPSAFFPLFVSLARFAQYAQPNHVIEGDIFLPKQVKLLSHHMDVKCLFLGTSNVQLSGLKINTHNDWVSGLPRREQAALPQKIISVSEMFKTEAEKYKIPYFDLSADRAAKLEEAYSLWFPKDVTST